MHVGGAGLCVGNTSAPSSTCHSTLREGQALQLLLRMLLNKSEPAAELLEYRIDERHTGYNALKDP